MKCLPNDELDPNSNSSAELSTEGQIDIIKHKHTFSTEELEAMKNKIEGFSKNHQIEILKILKKNPKVIINENKNGVFINLSFLPESILEDINYYLKYIHAQENDLSTLETQKNEFKTIYFTKEKMNE